MTLRIEHHPENGHAPWVVIAGPSCWFAYPTIERAGRALLDPDMVGFDKLLSSGELVFVPANEQKAVSAAKAVSQMSGA